MLMVFSLIFSKIPEKTSGKLSEGLSMKTE